MVNFITLFTLPWGISGQSQYIELISVSAIFWYLHTVVVTDVCSGVSLRMIISLVQWNNFTTVGYSVYLYGNVKINPCAANVENMVSS